MAHYVDKQKLHEEILKYQAELKEAEEKGLPEPKANRYIAQAILDMVKGMGQKFNYRDYTWLDEMQGAAIISCVKAIKKYDPSKSNNPFGFLDQCIAWAFHAIIKEENTRAARKVEMMRDMTTDYFSRAPDGTEFMIPREELLKMLDE